MYDRIFHGMSFKSILPTSRICSLYPPSYVIGIEKKEYRYESCTYVASHSFLRVSIIVPHSYRSFFQIFKFIESAYERNKNRMKTTAKKYEILYIIELSKYFYNKIYNIQ